LKNCLKNSLWNLPGNNTNLETFGLNFQESYLGPLKGKKRRILKKVELGEIKNLGWKFESWLKIGFGLSKPCEPLWNTQNGIKV